MTARAALQWVLAGGMVALGLLLSGMAQSADAPVVPTRAAQRTPQPVIEPARGGQCVEDPAFMRRNHVELLKHDRDDTVRNGVRATKYSLKACIGCHASKVTDSVSATSTNFCQSCHVYAAVKIDCFECHADKPAPIALHPPVLARGQGSVGAKLTTQLRQLMTSQQARP